MTISEMLETENAVSDILAIVLPAFNEEGKVGRVVSKVAATGQVDKIVVVDDCSTDRTPDEAAEAGAHVIRHKTNLGVGAAIRSGLAFGKDNDFNIGVILSSRLSETFIGLSFLSSEVRSISYVTSSLSFSMHLFINWLHNLTISLGNPLVLS